jgi:uncharacterized phage protein gp47/JayE
MPFSRPPLTGLRDQAVQDITASGVPGLSGLLRHAVLRVLAYCMAGLAYLVYGYADWIARMGVPFTAADEFMYAWAALVGIYPSDATPARGQALFSGVPDRLLPAQTPLTRQDGTPYEVAAEGHVGLGGFVTVPIMALVSGAYTNCDPQTPISIARPISGINSGGITVGETIGGADQEPEALTRNRMLARYREPPQGGAYNDYQQWALEVPGVTRAWTVPLGYGAGTVIVYPMFDDNQHGGFPQGADGVAAGESRQGAPAIATGDQLLVADHIWSPQPVTALVIVSAPTPHPVDVTLIALEPNTEDIRAGVVASLRDLFLISAEVAGTLYPSQFYEAILATPGISHFTVSAPAGPVTAPGGALPVLGQFQAPAMLDVEPTQL